MTSTENGTPALVSLHELRQLGGFVRCQDISARLEGALCDPSTPPGYPRGAPLPRSSQTFAALADPTRRAILKRLAAGPANVKELSRPFDMSGPAVCKHLRVLERAGLVRRRREAQSRPCELDPAPLKEIAA